ncbi:hypothetical protein [Cumulibacter manganitolerans]|uniref:hypothetical protein n=1 Tax=Cumulibacter manganitolerans TaxID=1884992 RepID=UPI001885E6F9|nr:hypothetical protein [Cumulibacter manganitolerans]
MYLQIMTFDGQRSAAAVQAASRAATDRIVPLLRANPVTRDGILGAFHGRGPDGAECHVVLTRDVATLEEMGRLVTTSELLPGEDPQLLTGPTRVQRFEIVDSSGPIADALAEVAR